MAAQVTDEQIERMSLVIEELARRGNAAAVGMAKSLQGKPLAERRNLALGFYSTLFEALTCMQMAITSTRTPNEIVDALKPKA